jgi:hypothetical protein
MHALTRPEPLPKQAALDLARYSRIELAARRAAQHIQHGHRADELRALREIQVAVSELTSYVVVP